MGVIAAAAAASDKADVAASLADAQSKLQAKREEFHAIKEIELAIANEFFSTVPAGERACARYASLLGLTFMRQATPSTTNCSRSSSERSSDRRSGTTSMKTRTTMVSPLSAARVLVISQWCAVAVSESEEEESEAYDSEDEDEEEEDVDDSCPPGCDTQLYETVIEQRSRRFVGCLSAIL
jgi:hypothetical protein